jgi:hypothetical protein
MVPLKAISCFKYVRQASTMGVKDTAFFEKQARKAFDEIDVDKSGAVDYKEVCIGIYKIYDNLNMKFPAHVPAPKR